MKGKILAYSIQSNSGTINGDDGKRYKFTGDAWRESEAPTRGDAVDFEARGGYAHDVFLDQDAAPAAPRAAAGRGQRHAAEGSATDKNKVAAGLLGIFLGGLGIHKFYLGYTKPAVIQLLCGTIGWLLILPGAVSNLIGLIEGIIYLTKSDEDFQATYVENQKFWM